MRADIILWNAIAKRRRSPSDTILDNGLGILKTYIENYGYKVEVVDWAQTDFWMRLTPHLPARLNRLLADILFTSRKQSKAWKKTKAIMLLPIFFLSQKITIVFQRRTLKKQLRDFAESVKQSGCRIFGIKTWYGDAYVTAKELANMVKSIAPDILVVAGGPHASIYREAVLEDDCFDAVVVGEGEKILTQLLSMSKQPESKIEVMKKIYEEVKSGQLNNIICRNGNSIAISKQDDVDAQKKVTPSYENIDGKVRIHIVIDALGCPWGKCGFCVHSCIYPQYSQRYAQSIVDEIEEMVGKGIGIFRFAGSTSTLSHIREIATLLQKKKLRIMYSMFVRAESQAGEQSVYSQMVETYRVLIQSGLRAAFLGVEAADDFILDSSMNKGITLDDITATIHSMKEASSREKKKLAIGLSLIYPAPTFGHISLEDLKSANIELVEKVHPDSVLINPPAPFPGTTWNRNSTQFGFTLGKDFTKDMLVYDYVLYKPPSLWPDISMELEGMNFKMILKECMNLSNMLEEKGYTTNVTDEHFLMLDAAGLNGASGVADFKKGTLLDIISSDYRWIDCIENKVNQTSKSLSIGV